MNIVIMVAQLILGLSILVVLHELGHFLAARAFGIRVEKFYLFFDAWNFKLFSFKIGETEYGMGWLPLGGYVKIAGMIDESMDKEQLSKPVEPWEFRAKPAWQRLIVMIGGVTVNLVLGILVFAFILLQYEKEYLPISQVNKDGVYASVAGTDAGFKTGDKVIAINGEEIVRFKDVQSLRNLFGSVYSVERDGQKLDVTISDDFYKTEAKSVRNRFLDASNFAPIIDSVIPGFPAQKAGLLKKDHLLTLNGTPISSYGAFRDSIIARAGDTVRLAVLRDGDTTILKIANDSMGFIGITAKIPYTGEKYSVGSALRFGFNDAMDMLVINVKGLGKVFSGKEKATESIQGPIGIARIYGSQWVWSKFWYITGLLSLVLAFMNILPIPALDGGHVVFLFWEIITGKKPSDKFLEYAQIVGMVILFGIMAFAFGNDILKLFR